jgi:hypothetical protein
MGIARIVALAAVLAAPGCRQIFGLDTPATIATDASNATDSDAGVCFGADPYTICPASLPTGSLDLGGVTIDTTTCPDGQIVGTQPSACVLIGTTINVFGVVRAIGARPLVLLSTGDLTVDATGVVDVSSSVLSGAGAGANSPDCSVSQPGSGGAQSASGGAGGSYGTLGGSGGFSTVPGGAAGIRVVPTSLAGGCKGGDGGALGGGSPSAGGPGGGAVYLIAQGQLAINGKVNASGAGGKAGVAKSGGSGGGSGGMIALFGGTGLTVTGSVFANGGGGGGGGDLGNPGVDGAESLAPMQRALGGQPQNNGAVGGDGAIATQNGGAGQSAGNSRGGGGGGGAVGVVKNVSGPVIMGSNISPPAT